MTRRTYIFQNPNLHTEEIIEEMRKNHNIIGDDIRMEQPDEPLYIPERIYPKDGKAEYIPDLNLAPDLVEFNITDEDLKNLQKLAEERYSEIDKMKEHSAKVRRDGIIDAMMYMVDLQDSHSKEPQPHFPHLKIICATCMKIFRILPTFRNDYEIIQDNLENDCPWCKGVMDRVVRPVMEMTEY